MNPTSAFCNRVTFLTFATLRFAHLKNGNATHLKMVVDAVLYLPSDFQTLGFMASFPREARLVGLKSFSLI